MSFYKTTEFDCSTNIYRVEYFKMHFQHQYLLPAIKNSGCQDSATTPWCNAKVYNFSEYKVIYNDIPFYRMNANIKRSARP